MSSRLAKASHSCPLFVCIYFFALYTFFFVAQQSAKIPFLCLLWSRTGLRFPSSNLFFLVFQFIIVSLCWKSEILIVNFISIFYLRKARAREKKKTKQELKMLDKKEKTYILEGGVTGYNRIKTRTLIPAFLWISMHVRVTPLTTWGSLRLV